MIENLSTNLQNGIDFFVNQMPGYVMIKDLKFNFCKMNKNSSEFLFDKKDPFEMIGATDHDMKEELLHMADSFIKEDKKLLIARKPIQKIHSFSLRETLIIHHYNKSILSNESGDDIAIMIHTYEIQNTRLIRQFMKLSKMDHSRYGIKGKIPSHNYSLTNELDDVQLSDRQAECLFYLLRGKSAPSIAKICNLSLRTIETYIDQIKNKMGCRNKSELIEKAINKGYINHIPKRILDDLDKVSR